MSRDGLNLGLECAKAPFVNVGGKPVGSLLPRNFFGLVFFCMISYFAKFASISLRTNK